MHRVLGLALALACSSHGKVTTGSFFKPNTQFSFLDKFCFDDDGGVTTFVNLCTHA